MEKCIDCKAKQGFPTFRVNLDGSVEKVPVCTDCFGVRPVYFHERPSKETIEATVRGLGINQDSVKVRRLSSN
jgi:hypothetical protein